MHHTVADVFLHFPLVQFTHFIYLYGFCHSSGKHRLQHYHSQVDRVLNNSGTKHSTAFLGATMVTQTDAPQHNSLRQRCYKRGRILGAYSESSGIAETGKEEYPSLPRAGKEWDSCLYRNLRIHVTIFCNTLNMYCYDTTYQF